MLKKEQNFHPNGQLKWEGTFDAGRPHGIQRWWHSNGVMADELPMRYGEYDGIGKHWNEKGDLVGTWEVRNGKGVVRHWHPNDVLSSEMPYLNGEWTGRQRVWFEDGELVTEVYWLRGRKVSRKKYLEACKTDPLLPTYEHEPKVQSWETKMKRLEARKKRNAPVQAKPKLVDKFLTDLLEDTSKREARAWLHEALQNENRTLGEIPTWRESLALVEEAYADGIAELFVVKESRQEGVDKLENTGTLLARLPVSGKKRKSALAWCNDQNDFQGFDPEDDTGQEWMVVQLD